MAAETLSIRSEAPLPGHAIVVRGGIMQRDSIETAIQTSFDEFGLYGLSVFAHATWSARQIWEQTPELARYRRVRTSTVAQVLACGVELLPTWEAPHYDVALPGPLDLDMWEALDHAFNSPTNEP